MEKIQELKPTTDEGKKTLADFLASTTDKVTNHYSEKALKLDIKESDSQFQDKQTLETTITSLQKILEIIKDINSTNEQTSIEEKINQFKNWSLNSKNKLKPWPKKKNKSLIKKETETTSSEGERETHSSEGGSYTPTYTESNGNRYSSQAPASEQYSSDSARSGGNTATNTRDQATDTAGAQGDTNTNNK